MFKLLHLSFLIFSVGAMAAPVDPLANFFKDKSKIDRPFDLRDPFKAPQIKSEKNTSEKGFASPSKGNYSNIKEDAVKNLNELKLVGVLIGKERRALVNTGRSIVILREGARIGDDGAELKAIMPGGIILVEKIVNVYGQEEYLETVIPISK
jgi:Tfp pilus assembly protein PilP